VGAVCLAGGGFCVNISGSSKGEVAPDGVVVVAVVVVASGDVGGGVIWKASTAGVKRRASQSWKLPSPKQKPSLYLLHAELSPARPSPRLRE